MKVNETYERPSIEVLSIEVEQPVLTGSGLEEIMPDNPDEDWL